MTGRNKEEKVTRTCLGSGGVHYAGASYRYAPYELKIYSKTVDKYGEKKIPEDMVIQDWGITYDELEKYYDKYEKMAGISGEPDPLGDRKSTRLNSSHVAISYAVFCLKKKKRDPSEILKKNKDSA